MRFRVFSLLIIVALTLTAQAEEVWVRNKPFEGAVEGSGSSLKVELQALLEALDLEAQIEENAVVFGDFRVPIETTSDGTQMVLLKDMTVGAGLKVTRNRELGTIDVYSTSAGTKSGGDWDDAGGGTASASSSSLYSIKVPPQLELIDDPSVMKALLAEFGGISNGDLRCLVLPRNRSDESLLMLLSVDGLPSGTVTKEMRTGAAQGYAQGMEQKGARRLAGPTEVRINGKEFVKLQHSLAKNGKDLTTESYLSIDGPRGRLWVVMCMGDQATFSQSAPPYQQAIQSLVLK
jgi:hypothetical protein